MVYYDTEWTKTAEQSPEKSQPNYESLVPLDVGMVLYDPAALGDTTKENEGVHKVYLGESILVGLTGDSCALWDQSALRKTIARGEMYVINIDALSDELQTVRLRILREQVEFLRSSATRYEEEGDMESAVSNREQANDIVEVLEAAGEEI